MAVGRAREANGLCIAEASANSSGDASLADIDKILPAAPDAYGGVVVEHSSLPEDADEFRIRLAASLEYWGANGTGGVWVKVPIASAPLIPELVAQGFAYHHAEPSYVMLTQWLKDTASPLPPNASHQVGIGAFVTNESGQVLMVQEGNGPLKGSGTWKMPTGLVAAGEDLHEAAPREVFEETGIRTTFESMLTVRQSHGMAFGKSDLFFVCALRAEPCQDYPKPCEVEIEAVKWAPLNEFLRNGFMRDRKLYSQILDTCEAWANGEYQGLRGSKLEAGVSRPRQDLLLHPGVGE